jgi:hypothetical protein
MKYAVGDVVWCRTVGKAAIIKAVNKNNYDVRTYDGNVLTVEESALGKE